MWLGLYTSDPTRECGGYAVGARDLVLVFELYNLSNILFLTVHSLVVILFIHPPSILTYGSYFILTIYALVYRCPEMGGKPISGL